MKYLVVGLMLLAGTTLQAEEAGKPWSGSAALGILATAGNSETTSSNLGLGLNYNLEQWHHEAAHTDCAPRQ